MACILQVQDLIEQISHHQTEYRKAFEILVVGYRSLIDNAFSEYIELLDNEFDLLTVCLLKYYFPVLKGALSRDFVLLLQIRPHYLFQLAESFILELGSFLQEVEEHVRALVVASL